MNPEQEQNTNAVPENREPSTAHTTPNVVPGDGAPVAEAPHKNRWTLIVTIVAVLLLIGAAYYIYTIKYADGGVVAVVNGEKLYQAELDENIANMTEGAELQGIDTTDPEIQEEIRNQSLKMLIDDTLLFAAAIEAGAVATEGEIDAQYAEIVTQVGGEEELETQLAELGITPEELREDIYERALVNNYLEMTTDIEEITVTEEDVTAFLADFDEAELPPLEEIRPQVEAQILSQKQQEILTRLIEELRSEAVIEER